MKATVPPLDIEAADEIASILIESGLDTPKPVRGRKAGASPARRIAAPQRRGFIDLAWKLGVASGTTLLISSLGWGVAYSNHDRAVRAETRAEIEIEYRHQAELNQLEAQRLAEVARTQAEVARRQIAEEARYTLQLEQWQRKQEDDERKISQREQEWQTILADAVEGVQHARSAGNTVDQTTELYFLARRIQTLAPDDEMLLEQFTELIEDWINSLDPPSPERTAHDGDA